MNRGSPLNKMVPLTEDHGGGGAWGPIVAHGLNVFDPMSGGCPLHEIVFDEHVKYLLKVIPRL